MAWIRCTNRQKVEAVYRVALLFTYQLAYIRTIIEIFVCSSYIFLLVFHV
jgi:hypothetical protein